MIDVEDLEPSACYPGAPADVEILQTHISIVCLAGDRVYKLKKPVRLPFLDFTTLERRRHFCEEEVRLNRRLCPDVYLGVVPLRRSGRGLTFGDDGEIVDHAVLMRRLPGDRMLDRLLAEDTVSPVEIDALAQTIAAFHARAERNERIRELGGPETLARLARENFRDTRNLVGPVFDGALHRLLEQRTEDDFRRLRPVLERRAATGHVVDGHGDLHARNVCMTDPPMAYDCIEFSEAFRCADVATENAFLTMDLRYRGHRELAARYVDAYVDASGDAEQRGLLPALERYRALVRAKVAALATGDEAIAASDREGARDSAARHLRLAAALAAEEERAVWIAACGLPASGKTFLVAHLAHDTGWPVLTSDHIRKELAGVTPTDPAPAEAYSEVFSDRTYGELERRAAAHSGVVLLDANWPTRRRRDALRAAAARAGATVLLLLVSVPEAVARGRLLARGRDGRAVSDATVAVYEERRRVFERPSDDETPVLVLDGAAEVGANADRILARLLDAGIAEPGGLSSHPQTMADGGS